MNKQKCTHSPQVSAITALGELSDNTGCTTGARAVADGGGDIRLLDGVGGSTLLASNDLDTSSRGGDGNGLTHTGEYEASDVTCIRMHLLVSKAGVLERVEVGQVGLYITHQANALSAQNSLDLLTASREKTGPSTTLFTMKELFFYILGAPVSDSSLDSVEGA